ncbi:MAG: hypothetical protein AAF211_30520, partial [Myxococcota bacterium]
MSARWRWLVGIGVVWMALATCLAPIYVPANWTARNVPPHLRADRWELTPDGQRAHALFEERCGELAAGAWIDFPPDAWQPELKAAPDDWSSG